MTALCTHIATGTTVCAKIPKPKITRKMAGGPRVTVSQLEFDLLLAIKERGATTNACYPGSVGLVDVEQHHGSIKVKVDTNALGEELTEHVILMRLVAPSTVVGCTVHGMCECYGVANVCLGMQCKSRLTQFVLLNRTGICALLGLWNSQAFPSRRKARSCSCSCKQY